MPESAVLQTLAGHLHGDNAVQARATAWEVLRLAERLADRVAWENGIDTVQALAAAHSCREARRHWPVPATGTPAPQPGAGPGEAAQVMHLLGVLADRIPSLLVPGTERQTAAARTAKARTHFELLTRSWPGTR